MKLLSELLHLAACALGPKRKKPAWYERIPFEVYYVILLAVGISAIVLLIRRLYFQ